MSDEEPDFEPTRRQWAGYWSMIVQQTQNAFNDKMAQFILIPLAGAISFQMVSVENSAALMIGLPFVLFAPLAGWLSDRFSKRSVMLGSAIAQMLILSWITGAVFIRSMPLALCGFFLLAVQSAFYSPAKIGLNKELVGSKHLGFAAGIQQMMAMLAILIGQVVAGWWFDLRFTTLGATDAHAWEAALFPLGLLTVCSIPAIAFAIIVPRTPAHGGEKLRLKTAVSHFRHLGDLWKNPPLRQASFGIAFFWGFAAYLNLWSIKVAKAITGGGEGFGTLSSNYMAAASLGMVVGFGCAAFLLRKRIELGWVPLAGLAMTAISVVIAAFPLHGWLFLTALSTLAFSSAIFLAPLNAWIQDNYPADKRGELQAAVNLQDCLAGIIAIAIIIGFEDAASRLGLTPLAGLRLQIIFVAASCAIATLLIIRILPAHFIRVIGTSVTRFLYRIRVVNQDRLPMSGGVLLLPNHVTYADSFFIATACPRPIRFVMDESFRARRSIRIFTAIFDTVTIRRDHPLEAIREVIRALESGHLVCLFPEGQLTRTGTLCELQRGFELIARKAAPPIIPLYCDASWGSIFSFERNHFFRKLPRRDHIPLTLAFGENIPARDASLESVRHGILTASADAIARRYAKRQWTTRKPSAKNTATRAFLLLDPESRRRAWVNGHQIGMVNAIQRHSTFHILKDDPILTEIPGLLACFPCLFKSSIEIHHAFNGESNGTWVGGDILRHSLQRTQITAKINFYDFGSRPLKPVERAGVAHCPCLAVDGIVVAMSMPHPPAFNDNFPPQLGRKPRSWGKLLPGFHLSKTVDDAPLAHGPAAPPDGLPLPVGSHLDPQGFIIGR
ncbi:MAG: MFS transporter [Verrucomicrobiota bacterium JB025]|nr:MFS transporter [Verrucomicrobiota bacterium JB025]